MPWNFSSRGLRTTIGMSNFQLSTDLSIKFLRIYFLLRIFVRLGLPTVDLIASARAIWRRFFQIHPFEDSLFEILHRLCRAEFNESAPLNGIIAKLTVLHGGNVHDRGIVNVTASSLDSSSYSAANVANLTDESGFLSVNGSD
jgi:hypothetical protein